MHWLIRLAGLTLMTGMAGCSDSDEDPSRSEPSGVVSVDPDISDVVVPPYGAEYVGLGSVSAVVPQGMRRETVPCRPDRRGPARAVCLALELHAHKRSGSRLSVRVLPADTLPSLEYRLEETKTDSSLRALVGDACPANAFCVFPYGRLLTVPTENFAMFVYGGVDERETADGIVQSVSLLAEGTVAVPPVLYGSSVDEAERVLSDAGLRAEVDEMAGPHYATGTAPPAGSVVYESDVPVRVLVGDG